jgi:putative endonuclease
MKLWHVYILRCGDNSLYCGVALDVGRRLREHQSGRGSKYLRGRGPLQLVYARTFASKGEALSAEARIKKLSRGGKERLLQSSVPQAGFVADAG